MVEADDVEARGAGIAAGLNVIPGIDDKPRRLVCEVARAHRLGNGARRSDEHPTALCRSGLSRMRDEGVADGARKNHRASIAMAMPIPPPMHSAATP